MSQLTRQGAVLGALVAASLSAQPPVAWTDPSTHTARFVTVDEGVRLEALEWDGSGRPVVLLAGAGSSAHVVDEFQGTAESLTGLPRAR